MESTKKVLSAEGRSEKGKGPNRRLRAKGLIPAVVYGQRREPTHVSVDPAALQKAIATPHKFNTLLTLSLDGAGDKQVLFKDYAVDPVSRKLLHADFIEVEMDKPVRVQVPIAITGRAEGVAAGGILTVSAHEITVETLPGQIPARIDVDVTALKIGGSIHIADVKAPEGAKVRYQTNFTVAVVTAPEKEEVAVPTAAAAAPAEGAAAAPAAAAAAGAKAAPAAAAPAKGDAKKK
jgi:large subunit ribosomal protein L25